MRQTIIMMYDRCYCVKQTSKDLKKHPVDNLNYVIFLDLKRILALQHTHALNSLSPFD